MNGVNFQVGMSDPFRSSLENGAKANLTVMAVRIGILFCPSDAGGGDPGWTGGTNYRFNLGWVRFPDDANGAAGPFGYSPCAVANVTDGLGSTVFTSEKVRGGLGEATLDPFRHMIVASGFGNDPDEVLATCQEQVGTPRGFDTRSGLSWFMGSLSHTLYDHVQGPNSRTPDYIIYGIAPVAGLLGARSAHGSGVYAGMGDGSVRYVRNGVDRVIWKAIGTRGRGEITNSDSF